MGSSRLPYSSEYPDRLFWPRRHVPCGASERWVVLHGRSLGLEEEE